MNFTNAFMTSLYIVEIEYNRFSPLVKSFFEINAEMNLVNALSETSAIYKVLASTPSSDSFGICRQIP